MKYASRHELYPVPNVLEFVAAREIREDFLVLLVADRTVACVMRPSSVAARDAFVVVRWVVARGAPDADVARETVVRCDDGVVVRADTPRDDDSVVRCETFLVALARGAVVRWVVVVADRTVEFDVRETASAAPMHTKHATRKDSILFIPLLILQ